jgi:hypothetical protein
MTFYTNSINLQITDTVRLTFLDVSEGVPPVTHGPVTVKAGEAILSMQTARALRDLLVQHIKDEPSAETVQ